MLRGPKKRSRTGCLTCRRRKKKCDESSYPYCRNCTSGKLQCTWPEQVVTERLAKATESSATANGSSPTRSEIQSSESDLSPLFYNALLSGRGVSKPENKSRNYILQRISMQQDCVEEKEDHSSQPLEISEGLGTLVDTCANGHVSSIRDRIARQLDISTEEINQHPYGNIEGDSQFRTN